jgi:hypothetical protein
MFSALQEYGQEETALLAYGRYCARRPVRADIAPLGDRTARLCLCNSERDGNIILLASPKPVFGRRASHVGIIPCRDIDAGR